MRGPPHAETYSDAQGPGLLIQSLRLLCSPCNYIALIILIIPVWDDMHRIVFVFLSGVMLA